MKISTQTIKKAKGNKLLVCVTAYDAVMAKLADQAGVDLILVGDSVGTTLLGYDTTVPVSLDVMVHHSAAVSRAQPQALVVADLPFPEAHFTGDTLLRAAARLMQEGQAEAVKLEGGSKIASKVAMLTDAGVPVMGHIGLLPQQVYKLGGYRKFGKTEAEKASLLEDAKTLTEAGAFAIVAEMVEPATAKEIAQSIPVPLIGIGSGVDCDGQILVSHDLLGLCTWQPPSFVKQFGKLADQAKEAFENYAQAVRDKQFPSV